MPWYLILIRSVTDSSTLIPAVGFCRKIHSLDVQVATTKEKDYILIVSIDELHEIGDESNNKSAANWLLVPAMEMQK